MASNGTGKMLTRNAKEIYVHQDFIIAVPAGASDTGDIALPEGFWHVTFLGTQTASGTPPTIQFETYLDTAKTRSVTIPSGIYDDGTLALATTLDVAKSAFTGILSYIAASSIGSESSLIYVGPGGLKWTYTKNGGTAIRLTLAAVRVA